MPPYTKSRSDLLRELAEQVQALRDSAAAYDQGKLWEAKRLATTSYILLHHKGRNRALLFQLGLHKSMQFMSTVKPAEIGSPLPLAKIVIEPLGDNSTYAPFLEADSTHREWVKFSKWYNESVFGIGNGRQLSRKNLIYSLRNQMGGGHVDEKIDNEEVQWLTRGLHKISVESGPMTVEEGSPAAKLLAEGRLPLPPVFKGGHIPNGHYATMRQIAWELDKSLAQVGI